MNNQLDNIGSEKMTQHTFTISLGKENSLRLIIGGDSKIGSAIANHWTSKGRLHYSTRNKN